MSVEHAEAALEAAQAELDKNPHSRPAQRDYEAKLADWERADGRLFSEPVLGDPEVA